MVWDFVTDETYCRLSALAQERRVVVERLDRIEHNRAAVKESVYFRVKSEYDARKAESDSLMLPAVESLVVKLREIVDALPGAMLDLEGTDEKIQEIEFRHSLGEYSGSERETLISQVRGQAGESAGIVSDGLPKLKAYGELLGGLFPEFERFLQAEKDFSSGTVRFCLDEEELLNEDDLVALDRLDEELMQGPCVDEQTLLREVEGISEADLKDIEVLGKDLESDEIPGIAAHAAFDSPFALSDYDDDDSDSESLIDESGDLGISLTSLLSPYALSGGHPGRAVGGTSPSGSPPACNQPLSPAAPVPPSGGPPMLIKFSEDGTNQEFPMGGEEVAIGRAADNDIVLLDKTVSRHHALISCEQSGYVLTDLNSTKGTLVNGRRETSRTIIDGDEILIGTITFKVRIPR